MKREILINKRKEKHMTQLEVATRIGVSKSHYSNIEAGKRGISLEQADKISKVLKIKFEYKNFI